MNVIERAVSISQSVSGLDEKQAKLAVYFSIATWKLAELCIFFILVFSGPPGSGKTSAINILKCWCNKPKVISGKNISAPALRDALASAESGTALIEEADEADQIVECEKLYAARFDITTANLVMKEQFPNGERWNQSPNLFQLRSTRRAVTLAIVAIVIHPRYVLKEYALDIAPFL
jgi:hypothetical protein